MGYTSGGGIKILLYLFVFPILLFALALFLLLVPLPRPFPPAGSKGRNLAVALITLFNGMVFVVWICLYSFWRIARASHGMDPVFLERGFRLGKAYFFARTIRGEYKGLSISGELFPDYKLQPWRFTISANASPGFNGAISNRKPVVYLPNAAEYKDEGGLSSLYICCDQSEMMKKMLWNPEIKESIEKIRSTLSTADTWQIIIRPKQIQFVIIPHAICHESMGIWLESFYLMLDFLILR